MLASLQCWVLLQLDNNFLTWLYSGVPSHETLWRLSRVFSTSALPVVLQEEARQCAPPPRLEWILIAQGVQTEHPGLSTISLPNLIVHHSLMWSLSPMHVHPGLLVFSSRDVLVNVWLLVLVGVVSEPWSAKCGDSYVVNPPSVVQFQLTVWRHWAWSWWEMCTTVCILHSTPNAVLPISGTYNECAC